MSELTKFINSFFKKAIKKDIDDIKDGIILTDRQEKIFELYYIRKKSIIQTADMLNVCPMVINKELKLIRYKIIKVLDKNG